MSTLLDPGQLHRLPPWPLVLAGPIVRRVDRDSAAVFVATSRSVPTLTLTVFDGAEEDAAPLVPQNPGQRATLALGANLHVCVVQATGLALEPGRLYGYDLEFATADGPMDLAALGLLNDPVPLGYFPGLKPAFVLPGSLDALRVVHASCRKFHGSRGPAHADPDALPLLDRLIQDRRADAESRPQQLFLTGDQIYTDDVPAAMLAAATSAGNQLLGWTTPEQLPDGAGGVITDEALLAPGQRSLLLDDQGVKSRPADADLARWDSDYAANHVLFFAEWCALYLFAWSQELWQETANIPGAADSGTPFLYYLPPPEAVYPSPGPTETTSAVPDTTTPALIYAQSVPIVRRALANVATYMIIDDHDVTDDWFLDAKVSAQERGTLLGRRLMRNALSAYAIFQHWGNDPSAFAAGTPGAKLLSVLDAASGTPTIGQPEGETAADVILDVGESPIGVDRREERMRWDYELVFDEHRVIVVDTRTWRGYPGGHRAVTGAELLAAAGQRHTVTADWGPVHLANLANTWTSAATTVPPKPAAFVAAGADLITDVSVLGSLAQAHAKSFTVEANATLTAAQSLLTALDAAPGTVQPMQAHDWIADAQAALPKSAVEAGDTVEDAVLRVAAKLCAAVFVLRNAQSTSLSADGSLDDAGLAVQTVADILQHTAAFLQGAVHSLPRAARHASALAVAWSAVAADSVEALWSSADASAAGPTLFAAGVQVAPTVTELAAAAAEFAAVPDPVAALLTDADRRGAAELISAEALTFQVSERVADPTRHRPLELVVSPAPVFGNWREEQIQLGMVYGTGAAGIDPFPEETNDFERWPTNPAARTRFLDALAPLGSVVFLSGDVHYSLSSVTDYLAGDGRPARFLQLTSSSAKNATTLTVALGLLDNELPPAAPTETTPLDGLGNLPSQADKDTFDPAIHDLVPSYEEAQSAVAAQLDELADAPPDPAMTSWGDGFNIQGIGTVLADPDPVGFGALDRSADAATRDQLSAVTAGADDPTSADLSDQVHAPTLAGDRPQALEASVGADPRRLPEIVTTVLRDRRIEDRAADSPGLDARLGGYFSRLATLQAARITVGYNNIGVVTTRGSPFGRFVVHEIHWFPFDAPPVGVAPDQPGAAFRDDWIMTRHCGGLTRGSPADGGTVGVCVAGPAPAEEIRLLIDVSSPDQIESGAARVHAIAETGPTMPDLTVQVWLTGVTSAADAATARDVRLECTYIKGGRGDVVLLPGPTVDDWHTLAPGETIWHHEFADFCGGDLRVFARATFGGVPVEGVTPLFSQAILGRNPPKADIRAQASTGATGPTTNLDVVFHRESSFTQFAASAAELGPYVEGPATVLKSPDRSFGAGQLDTPVPLIEQLWNWEANVKETVARLLAFRADAVIYQGQVQHGDPWNAATGKLNPAPPDEGVAHPEAPDFTTDQLDLEMWARYNSGRRYHDWSPSKKAWVRQPSTSTGVTVYAPALLDMRRRVEAGELPSDW